MDRDVGDSLCWISCIRETCKSTIRGDWRAVTNQVDLVGCHLRWRLSSLFDRWITAGIRRTGIGTFQFQRGGQLPLPLFSLWFALTLYTAAFIAENVRAGIQAVSQGQNEAAHALGLSRKDTVRLITIPQALRVIIPPTISQYLNLTKTHPWRLRSDTRNWLLFGRGLPSTRPGKHW